MPTGIIRDPKMNQGTEADFGIIMNIGDEDYGEFYLYFKGNFESNNPRRYLTAGTIVAYNGPVRDLTTPYPWNNLNWNETIQHWVRIHPVSHSSTGPVINDINGLINGKPLPFPSSKEYLKDYSDDQEIAEETSKYPHYPK